MSLHAGLVLDAAWPRAFPPPVRPFAGKHPLAAPLRDAPPLFETFAADARAPIPPRTIPDPNREALYEDDEFEERELAALVASKVFYHLGELDDSLQYALCAGALFDINSSSEYVQTIVSKMIDTYIVERNAAEPKEIDPKLVAIVESMLERCMADGRTEHAIGLALEARRLDKLDEAVKRSADGAAALAYAVRVTHRLVSSKAFRLEALRKLVSLYEGVDEPDFIAVCEILMFLDDPAKVADILVGLIKAGGDKSLMAYQICFDLVDNQRQRFLLEVSGKLPKAKEEKKPEAAPLLRGDGAGEADGNGAEAADAAAPAEAAGEGDAMETDEAAEGGATAATAAEDKAEEPEAEDEWAPFKDQLVKLRGILTGDIPVNLLLDFLYSRNHADLQEMKQIKSAVDARNSVCHSAAIFANALMHSGTTVDTFLRENLDWLGRATNWAKFSATAGLGAIHLGHVRAGRALVAPYLPTAAGGGAGSSVYSEGGALYALGLIHSGCGEGARDFLQESLRNTRDETIQHGACLGLGLAAMGTYDEGVFDDLRSVLFTDSAVAGEGAGLAMGMLLCGSAASGKTEEMLSYARDTQHEKIVRGLALGMALTCLASEESADTLAETLLLDLDPILRYGGMYTLGLAYVGTANNKAIEKLLHFAVSDASDDVRRAAVLNLGFVLCASPEQCPRIVRLLAESYSPHTRYGAAMAVGVSCAGTALPEAVQLLDALAKDGVDFVRQGAYVAKAMVLVGAREAKQAPLRAQLEKVIADKHEEPLAKMGAILAQGLLNGGGRNVTISLRSKHGFPRMHAVAGMAIFTQSWFWHPLTYFAALTFQPAALVAVNGDLKMPVMSVNSALPPSAFGYPAPLSDKPKKEATITKKAVLSTAARAKKLQAEKAKAKAEKEGKQADAMEVDGEVKKKESEGGEDQKQGGKDKDKKEPEATSEQLDNPARVVPAQERHVSFLPGSRFMPLKKGAVSGILVCSDDTPGEDVELVAAAVGGGDDSGAKKDEPNESEGGAAAAGGNGGGGDGDEPAPPPAFNFEP